MSWLWNLSIYIIYYIYYCMLCRKSLTALILRILASFINSKTIHKLLVLREKTPNYSQTTRTEREDTNQQQGRRPLVDLSIQWLEQ